MTKARPDEDLFAGTSMSFGEHLEELRSALIRALIGLAVGFLIGLAVGKQVVEIIKNPLERSLANYFKEGAILEYEQFVKEQEKNGLPVPYELDKVKHLVNDQGLVFKLYQIHPSAVRTTLGLEHVGKNVDKPEEKGSSDTKQGVAPKAADPPDKETVERAENREKTKEKESAENKEPVKVEPLTPLFVWQPVASDDRASIKSLSTAEVFMFYMKASLLAGALIASPWIFYQLWVFVGAGLYPTEKRFVRVFLPISLALFLTGAALCFFVVFPYVLDYLFSFNRSMGIAPDPRINEWLGFALFLPLGFGLSFQLPLVMLFLNRIGVFSIEAYVAKWKIAMLAIFVISMIITPGGDPISMLTMSISMTCLYLGGIQLCRWAGPRKNPLEE